VQHGSGRSARHDTGKTATHVFRSLVPPGAGRMKLLALVTDSKSVARYLRALVNPSTFPAAHPAAVRRFDMVGPVKVFAIPPLFSFIFSSLISAFRGVKATSDGREFDGDQTDMRGLGTA